MQQGKLPQRIRKYYEDNPHQRLSNVAAISLVYFDYHGFAEDEEVANV